MIRKSREKEKAILLRKEGFSYKEITDQVPVAKSTLSLWLRDVGLSEPQKQKLTQKKLIASRRGGEAKHQQKLQRIKSIGDKAKSEIKSISNRELWLMGIMLYWAEGSKEKEWGCGQNIQFSNSDSAMINLFIRWLTEIIGVESNRFVFGIYIHENHRDNIDKVREYWSSETGFPIESFSYVYFKKHRPKTKRKNVNDSYHGLLKLTVRSSSDLNRKISGWVRGINEYYCRVV